MAAPACAPKAAPFCALPSLIFFARFRRLAALLHARGVCERVVCGCAPARYWAGGVCLPPVAFFASSEKAGAAVTARASCRAAREGAAPARVFCLVALRIHRRCLLHKVVAQISPLSVLKLYLTTSEETGLLAPVDYPMLGEIAHGHSAAAIGT